MLDCQLYGLDPAGHHLTSLAFHIANTLLLFLLLQNLTARLWPSMFVALLFGIHPMHVESVAWVAERKDVLSGFFFLLTLLAYARYVRLVEIKTRQCWTAYGLTLLLFALGLMAKPMLVTLPCVLFLLDCWPLGRFQFPLCHQPVGILRRLALEKIPFFVLAAISCGITIHRSVPISSPQTHKRRSGGDAAGTHTRGLCLVCSQVVLAGQPIRFLSAAPFPAFRSSWGFGLNGRLDLACLPVAP